MVVSEGKLRIAISESENIPGMVDKELNFRFVVVQKYEIKFSGMV